MIIEYDNDGRIFHIISDPVPPGVEEAMKEGGKTFVSMPPIPLPAEHARDPESGDLLFEEAADEETGETHYEPVMESPGLQYCQCKMETHYVADGELQERPDCPATVAVEGLRVTLQDVPDGTAISVEIDGERIDLNANEFELDEPGPIRIHIQAPWPMKDPTLDVEVE